MPFIDLHIDWPLQYARECTLFDPTLYAGASHQLGQVAGYLQNTRLAVIACYRHEADWDRQPDPWAALGSLIACVESEISGRLLLGPEDLDRWRDDSQGMTWGMVGVEGFDALIRSPADLDRLPHLFERGVRLFQPTYGTKSLLAGSSAAGDDRGLMDLGRAFLDRLSHLNTGDRAPRPMLDLAHLNPRSMSDVLDWLEADSARAQRIIPVYSHGALAREEFAPARSLSIEALTRLRALGGVVGLSVGPPFYDSPDQIRRDLERASEIPFLGRPGFEGIALGTDFLGVDRTLPGLGNVAEIMTWVSRSFPKPVASSLLMRSAESLIARSVGSA